MLCSLSIAPIHLYSSASFLSFISIMYLLIPPQFHFSPPCSGFCSRKRGPLFLFLLLFSAFFCLHTYFLWCFPLHPPPHSRVFYVPLPLVSSFLFTVLYLCHVSLCTRCYMYLCIELFFSYRNSSCCTCFLISLFSLSRINNDRTCHRLPFDCHPYY